MSTQRKTVTWGKFGWKRVCKNTMRFGWESLENVEHTETTYTTNYEGEVVNDKVYIHENTSSSTKTRIHMSFIRDISQIANYHTIFILELIYNIFFLIHKIVAFLLPLWTAAFFILMLVPDKDFMFTNEFMTVFFGFYFFWIFLIIIENVIARIASNVIRYEK